MIQFGACWLRNFATSRKNVVSIPHKVIIFFILPNPSSNDPGVNYACSRMEYQESFWKQSVVDA
jgi:hypothetical protein